MVYVNFYEYTRIGEQVVGEMQIVPLYPHGLDLIAQSDGARVEFYTNDGDKSQV